MRRWVVRIAAAVLALLLATQARTQFPIGQNGAIDDWALPLPMYGMGLIVWSVAFVSSNVYNPRQIV